jgi:hypothetical protein
VGRGGRRLRYLDTAARLAEPLSITLDELVRGAFTGKPRGKGKKKG